MPQALAVAIPYSVFFNMAGTLSTSEIPVVVARNIGFPCAGVITRPTVETPMGKL